MPPKNKTTIVTEQDIVAASNEELIEIINNNINTKQDELFSKYKSKVQSQLEEDHELIESLQRQLQEKNERIEALQEELSALKLDSAVEFASPIRKKSSGRLSQDELERERGHISFTLDMIELLTGVKVTNFESSDDAYIYDIKQTSMNQEVSINYQLVLSTEPNQEIRYFPTFLDDMDENASVLQKHLPEYLCESLSFPYESLGQFYDKLRRHTKFSKPNK